MMQVVRRRPVARFGALVVGALAGLLTIVPGAPAARAELLPPTLRSAWSPFGVVDIVVANTGVIGVAGWAIDPDTSSPIAVHVYVDGTGYPATADVSRPDVGAVNPGKGDDHGYVAIVPASAGPHTVCVYGINVGLGENSLLGCRPITVPDGSPVGSLDVAVRAPGAVDVAGWAIDPETGDPIQVHVYVDSIGTPLIADQDRPDVGAAFPGYGSGHGFSARISVSPGPHQVCAFAINEFSGQNSLIGCRPLPIFFGSPIGALDVATGGTGSVHVAGWAIDPETDGPIDVHVYVDGSGVALHALGSRPDVANAYPGYRPFHGYDAEITAAPGTHSVCAYGINISAGGNSLLGCRTVTVS